MNKRTDGVAGTATRETTMKTKFRFRREDGGGAALLLAAALFFLAGAAQAGTVTVNADGTTTTPTDLNAAATASAAYNSANSVTFTLTGNNSLTGPLTFDRGAANANLTGRYSFIGTGTGTTINGMNTTTFSAFDNTDRTNAHNPISGVKEFDFQNLTITGFTKEATSLGVGGGAIRISGQLKTTAPTATGQDAYLDRFILRLDNVTLSNNKVITHGADADLVAGGGGFAANGGGELVSLQNFTITGNSVDNQFAGGNNWTYGGGFRAFNTTRYEIGTGEISNNTAKYSGGGGNNTWVIGGGASIETDAGNNNDGFGSESSTVNFTGTRITGNTASITAGTSGTVQGGGLYLSNTEWDVENKNTTSTLTNVTVTGNTASGVSGVNVMGGGIAQNGNTLTTITGGSVSSNTAKTADGTAQGGGIYVNNVWRGIIGTLDHRTRTAMTISGTTFSGNHVETTGSGNAQGGAVYMNIQPALSGPHTGTFTFSGATFSGNEAKTAAVGSLAQGGAIWSNYDFMDTGSTFTGNKVTGDGAQGGAIYSLAGDVTLTDSTFKSNTATGTSAIGGAIHMDTQSAERTLNLVASAGKATEFSNNTATGAVGPGNAQGFNSINFGGPNKGILAIAAAGTGSVLLLDPISANTTGGLDVNKTGAGNFTWGGANILATDTTVNISGGTFATTRDYTLGVAAGGGRDLSVTLNNLDSISFDVDRDVNTALFDFTDANTKTLNVTGGPNRLIGSAAAIGSVGDRPVESITTKQFLIVEGIDATQGDNFISGIDWSGNSNGWTYVDRLEWQGGNKASGNIVANAGYRSPFENSGQNALDAVDSLDDLINHSNLNPAVEDDEWIAMQNNARAVTPEIAMMATNVMLDGVARVQSMAVDYAVRNPHRLRMRMEDSYTRRNARPARRAAPAAAGAATATTDPVTGETVIFQQGTLTPGIENYQAYPAMRLEDCYFPGVGLRIWTGYTGEFRVQRDRSNLSGYDTSRHGVLLGLNYDFGTIASVGVYGGYTNADVSARSYDAEVDSDNGHFGIMGRVSPFSMMPELSFYADAGYHFANNDSARTMRNVNTYSANGSFDQDVWTFGLGAEYVIRAGMFNITPQADVRFSHLSQDEFTEGGNSATRARLDGVTAEQFNHRLGVEFSYDYLFAGGVVTPALSLGWKHDWANRRHDSTARYILDTTNPLPFNVAATPASRDSVDIGLALKSVYNITSSTKLGVNLAYNLNIGGRSYSHAVYAGVELGF